MKAWSIFALMSLVSAPALSAPDADVCYSAPHPLSMSASKPAQPQHLTAKTTLECPRAGNHTLAELVQAGWRIVAVNDESMSPIPTPTMSFRVVIERDR
ncbi:MAG TPA: hypothetical protein VFA81_07725 [Burkholderiales bacterium]|nr:hypothetical protein [Burkholderiales bacterium]